MQKVMHMLQNKKKSNFVVWLQIHNIGDSPVFFLQESRR